MPIPRISVEQRRARLGRRHRLAPAFRADGPVQAAEAVVALHATDPATVHLSALTRMRSGDVGTVERALYDDRDLVRMLGMRRTVFVAPLDVAPLIQAGCTRAVAEKQRRLLVKHLTGAGLGGKDPGAWLRDVEASTEAALKGRGTATASELAADEPRLSSRLSMAEGKDYAADVAITSRVLFLLGADGRIVRGRPTGGWSSTRYVWAPLDDWLGAAPSEPDPGTARRELIRRYLAAFGPAPRRDVAWWTGLGVRDVGTALTDLAAVDVDLDGQDGVVLPDDLPDDTEDGDDPGQWAAVLPGLDPTPMGWQDRDWTLGEHRKALTDRTGNVGPTLWWNGRVVGVWTQRTDGTLVHRLLEDVGTEGEHAVDQALQAMAGHLGTRRFSTKFPSPLERELRA